jgi:ABC-2 type transport system permease protein
MKNKSPNQLRAFFTLSYYFFRAQTRNPATFAFGFIFPIVFISIFGLIGTQAQKTTLGIPNETNTQSPIVKAVEKSGFIDVTKGSRGELEHKLNTGKLGGVLLISGNTGSQVTLETSSAQPQATGVLSSFINAVIDKTNLHLAGVKNPSVTFEQKEISGREFRYIDFALPGQIGFSLLSTAIFGTVFGLIFLKKSLVLKRMFSTPTRPLTILVAQGASRWVLAMLQTLLILAMGVFVFKFYLPHGLQTLWELIFLSSIGLIAFLGFGYFLAGFANDENSAGPLVNLITLPQFLLSGTFFPTDSLPTWLQPIANNLPLSYFNHAIRIVTTEGGTLIQTWPYMLGLLAWGVVMYLLAAKTFRWT